MSDAGSLSQPHPRIGISRCLLGEHVCLETWPRTGAHVNVLQHLAGHFRDRVDVHERAAMHSDIEALRAECLPLGALLRRFREGPINSN